MLNTEGHFTNHQDLEIYYQQWHPNDDPRAVIFLFHGLAEHTGRYRYLVQDLVPRGYAVYGIDLPGHGLSEGTRVYVDQFLDYIATQHQFFEMIRIEQPGKPVFLYGHSMGALIGASYALDYQDELAGMILTAPLSRVPDHISAFTVFMGKLFSRLLPKFGLVPIDSDGISSDPEEVTIYDDDPLVYRGKTTARLAAELLGAMQKLSREAGDITLPALVLQGSGDKLVNPDEGPYLHSVLGSEDKTLKVYDGFYHEIHNEPERELVFNDVTAWLDSHLPAGESG